MSASRRWPCTSPSGQVRRGTPTDCTSTGRPTRAPTQPRSQSESLPRLPPRTACVLAQLPPWVSPSCRRRRRARQPDWLHERAVGRHIPCREPHPFLAGRIERDLEVLLPEGGKIGGRND